MVPGMFRHLLLAFLSSFLIHAQDQPGFINIDCGLPENYSYTENETGLAYISDAAFIDTGISMSVSPEFLSDSQWQPLQHVRSFPQGIRNCYSIELSRGNKYLIRANFFYGNYDLQRRVPEFELHLGANLWDIVKLPDASAWIVWEIIHVPSSNYLSLCLVDTGFGTPFISAIELRPLRNSIYEIQSGSLELYWRYDIASSTNQIFRYKIDEYDRTWWPYNYQTWDQLNTSLSIDSQKNDFKPPSVIMGTAAVPKNKSMPLSLFLQASNQTNKFYAYMYFAEVEKLQANQFREFNISLNGQHWSGPHSPAYLEASTVYKTSPLTGQLEYEFLIYKARNSSLAPIINAIEVYKVNELPQLQTNQDDVDAVKNIQSTYKIKRNWQGDPCAPEAYVWNGLNCSYNDSPRIISMDLSNNSLVGEVPSFLSKLPLLRVLNLKKNKLIGSVPVELILRSKDGSLILSSVAVKMLSSSSVQSYKHFQAEAKLLLGVHHRNLINLVGYCNEGGLIYEYMANGSLEELLSDSSKHFLNWEGRLRVALDAAQGLEYLHKYCKPTMVHGNVKSSNILINDEFQVKLADFGLSGTFPNDEGTFLTSAAGTPGYPGHEYSDSKRLSEKTDVYSFGIVLLEMFTGKPSISRTSEKAHKDLVERLSSMLAKGDIEKIVDPRLKGNFGTQSVRQTVEVAMACISAAGTGRLTMDVVAMELNQCIAVEIAQNKKGHESKEKGSIEMITMNLDDDESILLGR
ncbi:probable LRR receptor-like serine/threonine-protein kinase At1g51860 [Herrania umbratica]|uniref:Probable LRR receptor-like serine/threonine-protein kinase At1g51860 n=1 Tax=Herrania umbratica TaxID=108875 RepID=A0A6J1B5H9_9ROSI|nr:probable LRR receptor-like serine/threonine-protein kinase At1g51860 [Herrania umbratica]